MQEVQCTRCRVSWVLIFSSLANHIFICTACAQCCSDAGHTSILMLICCSIVLSCLFRLFNALTSLWLAGPICHSERERVLWSRSDTQRAVVLDTKVRKMLSLLIGPFLFTSAAAPPFLHTVTLRTPQQTGHGVALQLGFTTTSFYFLSRVLEEQGWQVCTCSRVDGLNWKHARHLLVRFCIVYSAENTPGRWSEHVFGIDPDLPAGSGIAITQQKWMCW